MPDTDEMTIKTNNVPRLIINAYELNEDERKEYDYIKWDAIERGEDSASFIRYKGRLYDLGEFQTTRSLPEFSPLTKWDGYHNDSFFSGIVIRYCADHDHVVLGTFYA